MVAGVAAKLVGGLCCCNDMTMLACDMSTVHHTSKILLLRNNTTFPQIVSYRVQCGSMISVSAVLVSSARLSM